MNENLEEKLTTLLGYVEQGIETGSSFAAEQAPLLVQEVIQWGIARGIIYGVVFAVAAVIAAWAAKAAAKFEIEMFDAPIFSCSLGALMVFMCAGTSMDWLMVTIQAIVAPRLYVIEQLRAML